MEHIIEAASAGADYVGIGPFRFTTTKDNLNPTLGLNGIAQILSQCQKRNVTLPIIAIGGITESDVEALIKTGIYGIALSQTITFAKDKRELLERMRTLLSKGQSRFRKRF